MKRYQNYSESVKDQLSLGEMMNESILSTGECLGRRSDSLL